MGCRGDAYTRALLDPLPGREAIHKRLTELLSIGVVNPPRSRADIISIPSAKACRTSRCSTCGRILVRRREPEVMPGGRLNIPSRTPHNVIVCVDRMHLRLRHRRARLVSAKRGREVCCVWHVRRRIGDVSTLRVIETKTGTILPDTIERTRAASIAWLHDNSGFYYTRYPKKGDVPPGQEMYNRHIFFHLLGDRSRDTTIRSLARVATRKTGPACLSPTTTAGC